MSAQPPEQDWFEKAEQDLEMARRAMLPGDPIPAMACYHCQQCAEKQLKGFLVSRSIEFRPVHDLNTFPTVRRRAKAAFGHCGAKALLLAYCNALAAAVTDVFYFSVSWSKVRGTPYLCKGVDPRSGVGTMVRGEWAWV